jgi:PEP-CTERM motif
VFGTAAPSGTETLWIAVLTPRSTGSGTFSGPAGTNANLWAALGVSPTQNFPNFSSTASQELGATGIRAGSFIATSFQVGGPTGTWTGSVNSGQSVTLPNGPVGTIFIAYLLDSKGNLIAVSPWSSSLVFVPEPSSSMLLGLGLMALGALAGRRFLGN